MMLKMRTIAIGMTTENNIGDADSQQNLSLRYWLLVSRNTAVGTTMRDGITE